MMRIKKIRMAIVLIVALAVVLVSISGALADSVLKSPGDDTGNWFWYPERAYSDNGLFAKGKTGQVQQYFDYGFAIPAGATIDGIAVRLEARCCALASSGSIAVELSSDGGTSWTSTGYVAGALTLSEVTYTLGGATNNWGRTWTSAEINDNLNFKVRVTATASGRTPCVCLDWIPVRVYYNVAPTVDAGPDQTVDEGDTVSFSGSFTDPGADTHTIVWDFGDGSTAAGTLTPSHAYGDNGVYTVTLTVTDDDGGVGTDTLTVTVNNVAPTVNAGPDQTVHVDSDVSFSGSFTDPGVDDTHTKEWDFGDGGTATGTLTPIHVYDNVGVYTVTLTVTDDDGGVGKDTTTITVTIPDLVVSKSVEIDDCKFIVTYTVTNIGDVSAGASTTCKLVNGAILETQPCPALDPGESYSDTFNPVPCSCGEQLRGELRGMSSLSARPCYHEHLDRWQQDTLHNTE
jgi:PKD repeat protein